MDSKPSSILVAETTFLSVTPNTNQLDSMEHAQRGAAGFKTIHHKPSTINHPL